MRIRDILKPHGVVHLAILSFFLNISFGVRCEEGNQLL